jgi:hypothetical protein
MNSTPSKGIGLGFDPRTLLKDPNPINQTIGFPSNNRINWTVPVRIWDKNVSCVPTHNHLVFCTKVAPEGSTGPKARESVESRTSASFYRRPVMGFELTPPVDAFTMPQLNFLLAEHDVRRPGFMAEDLWFNGFDGDGNGFAIDGVTVAEEGATDTNGPVGNDSRNGERRLNTTKQGHAYMYNIFGRPVDLVARLSCYLILRRVRMGETEYNIDPWQHTIGAVDPDGRIFRPFQLIPYASSSQPEPPDSLIEYEDYPEEAGEQGEILDGKVMYVGRIRELPEADKFLRRNKVANNRLYDPQVMTSYAYHLGLPKLTVDLNINETV